MLFNMQTCIILEFQQNCSFCAIPQLPQVFGCPSFTPFDYIAVSLIIFFDSRNAKKHIKNNSRNLNFCLGFFTNHLKLVNLIPE